MKPAKLLWIVAGVAFAGATLWINYRVKREFAPQAFGGFVKELGEIKVGQTAPDFDAEDLAGHGVALADFRGKKPVLIDFWATWCGPCRQAMPDLQALHEEYGARLEILSLSQGEAKEKVAAFAAAQNYTLHFLLDADSSIGGRYGVTAIPTQVLIDETGVIRWIQTGFVPKNAVLRRELQRLLPTAP
jgi:peroxiredoxin